MNDYEKMVVSPKDKEIFEQIKAAREPYLECYNEVLRLSRASKRAEATALFDRQLEPLYRNFFGATNAEIAFNKDEADQNSQGDHERGQLRHHWRADRPVARAAGRIRYFDHW